MQAGERPSSPPKARRRRGGATGGATGGSVLDNQTEEFAQSRCLARHGGGVLALPVLCAIVAALLHNALLEATPLGDLPVDFPRYEHLYSLAVNVDLFGYLGWSRFEPGYQVLAWLCSNVGLSFLGFLFFLKVAFMVAYWRMAFAVSRSEVVAWLSSVCFVVSPFFATYTENAIRQGAALTVVSLALPSLLVGRRRIFLAAGTASAVFHLVGVLFVLIALGASVSVPKLSRVLRLTGLVMLVYVVDGWKWAADRLLSVLGSVSATYGRYALFVDDYVIGFKLAFFVASALLVLTVALLDRGAQVPAKWRPRGGRVDIVGKFVLLITCLYMVGSGVPYHDRVAAYSWVFIPLLGLMAIRRRIARSGSGQRRSRASSPSPPSLRAPRPAARGLSARPEQR